MKISAPSRGSLRFLLRWAAVPVFAIGVGASDTVSNKVSEEISLWRVLKVLRDEKRPGTARRIDTPGSVVVVLALRASECLMCNVEIATFGEEARRLKIQNPVVMLTGRDSTLREKVMGESEPGVSFIRLSKREEEQISQFARLPLRLLLRDGEVVVARATNRSAQHFWDEVELQVRGQMR